MQSLLPPHCHPQFFTYVFVINRNILPTTLLHYFLYEKFLLEISRSLPTIQRIVTRLPTLLPFKTSTLELIQVPKTPDWGWFLSGRWSLVHSVFSANPRSALATTRGRTTPRIIVKRLPRLGTALILLPGYQKLTIFLIFSHQSLIVGFWNRR